MEKQNAVKDGISRDKDEAPPNPVADNKSREQRESLEQGDKVKNKRHKKEYQRLSCTSSEHLFDQTQSLITEVNDKRKNDSMLLNEFKKAMEIHLEHCSSALEKALFHNYGLTGNIMQEKLQDLYATLDRITKLEQELVQFKKALGLLYNDVASS